MNGKRLVLGIGVVAFVIIVSIAIFSIDWGGGVAKENVQPTNIATFADTDTQVRMIVRGPIDSNQEHQEFQITVGRNTTIGDLLTGYEGVVAKSEQTANNAASYKAFLSALHNAKFTKQQLPPRELQYDGACANGLRYTFTFIGEGSNVPASSWATSCAKKEGTFAGNLSDVKNLFNAQLPEGQFDALTEDTDF